LENDNFVSKLVTIKENVRLCIIAIEKKWKKCYAKEN
jgi:hypothetical protein